MIGGQMSGPVCRVDRRHRGCRRQEAGEYLATARRALGGIRCGALGGGVWPLPHRLGGRLVPAVGCGTGTHCIRDSMEMDLRRACGRHVCRRGSRGSGSRYGMGTAPAAASDRQTGVVRLGAPGIPFSSRPGPNGLPGRCRSVSLLHDRNLGLVVLPGRHSVQPEYVALETVGAHRYARSAPLSAGVGRTNEWGACLGMGGPAGMGRSARAGGGGIAIRSGVVERLADDVDRLAL